MGFVDLMPEQLFMSETLEAICNIWGEESRQVVGEYGFEEFEGVDDSGAAAGVSGHRKEKKKEKHGKLWDRLSKKDKEKEKHSKEKKKKKSKT